MIQIIHPLNFKDSQSSVEIRRLKIKNKVLNIWLLFSAQNLGEKDAKFKDLDWNCIWSSDVEFTSLHVESLLEPNTTALFHRYLFSFFNSKILNYSMSKDFNFTGVFQAYWKELCTKGKKSRHSFGEKPLQLMEYTRVYLLPVT